MIYPDVWILCSTGPMQDEWHVKYDGQVLQRFTNYPAANAYRNWAWKRELWKRKQMEAKHARAS